MKLETIKKDKKKNVIIGSMIVLSVVGCLTLTTTRAKYRSVQSLKLASGIVKINSKYDFKIIAMYQSEDGTNYTDINTMPKTGYVINEDRSYCTTDNKTKVKGKLKTNSEGEHVFSELNKNDKCYIWFDKEPRTSARIIAAIIERKDGSYKGTATPTFTESATGAEITANNGIYVTDDPMYGAGKTTYYWRGAATTNHVIFDNKCWRIVRINGDGSIRLIYNGIPTGNTCPGNGTNANSVVLSRVSYNENYENSSYVGWTYTVSSQRPSNTNPQTSGTRAPLRVQLEDTWYANNITAAAKEKIATGYFCNDRNTKNNETWRATGSAQYYAGYTRFIESKEPTLSCPSGDIYELNIGMITADEAQFAGASWNTANTAYYLYNGQSYWTMTPYGWTSGWSGGSCMFYANTIGSLSYDLTGANEADIHAEPSTRPVINLRSDVTFNAGSDGTQNNPYIVQ